MSVMSKQIVVPDVVMIFIRGMLTIRVLNEKITALFRLIIELLRQRGALSLAHKFSNFTHKFSPFLEFSV